MAKRGEYQNISGKRFGRLVAIKHHSPDRWLFRCDCKKEKVILATHVKRGKIISCGCYREEMRPYSNLIHGMSHTRFYRIWAAIHDRCTNPNQKAYQWYGARGIKIEWRSFKEFRNSMYESYLTHCNQFGRKDTTIERINNDGNYSRNNCKWATRLEQANNQRHKIDQIRNKKGQFANCH